MSSPAKANEPDLVDNLIYFMEDHVVGEADRQDKNFHLEDFQIEWLGKTFGIPGVRRSILSVGRRNGKTATCALLVMAALYGPLEVPNARIISASRSTAQAAIIYEYVKNIAIASGFDWKLRFNDTKNRIVSKHNGATYKAISSDAARSLGYGARLIIHDELGQVRGPEDRLFSNLTTSLGSYTDALEIIVSTQAPGDDDLLSMLIDYALTGNDPTVVCSLFAAGKDDDIFDPAVWRKANPAMGKHRSAKDVENQANEAKILPAREAAFRNLTLNQRISLDSPFMTPSVWNSNDGEPDENVFKNNDVFGGLDLSFRQDLTSLVLCAEEDGIVHVKTFAWTPADTLLARARIDRAPYDIWVREGLLETVPGSSIQFEWIAHRIAEICEEFDPVAINYDRWKIEHLIHAMDAIDYDANLIPSGQGFKDMSPSLAEWESLAVEQRIRHGGNPVLRWCVANSIVTEDPAGNRKLNKKTSTGRIDAAVALSMAIKACRLDKEEAVDVENWIA